jgi:PTH1 family peptidyl-tRNA hydrolase
VGLGNAVESLAETRHNVGFDFGAYLAGRLGVRLEHHKPWNANIAQSLIPSPPLPVISPSGPPGAVEVLIAQPRTYMNTCGSIVARIRKEWKPTVMLVVHDELEKPVGKWNYKQGGSANGHNGVKSIIASVRSQVFLLAFLRY